MRKPGLVIFDCDGVLIDSELIGARVETEELARIGMPISEPEILARFLGMTAKEMYHTLEIEHGMALPPGFRPAFRRGSMARSSVSCKRFRIHEVLDRLAVTACVASSSTLARLRHSLGLAGLYERFAPHVFSAEQVARGKPAPDLFLYAAAQMACPPEACVVIEDSVSGVRAAVAAGMRSGASSAAVTAPRPRRAAARGRRGGRVRAHAGSGGNARLSPPDTFREGCEMLAVDNRVVMVSGASRGIGRAIAQGLLGKGYRLQPRRAPGRRARPTLRRARPGRRLRRPRPGLGRGLGRGDARAVRADRRADQQRWRAAPCDHRGQPMRTSSICGRSTRWGRFV